MAMTKYKGRGALQVTGRQTGKSWTISQLIQALEQKETHVMEIKVNEGRVFGARYHTAEPEFGWSHNGMWGGGVDAWDEMVTWTTDTFGPTPSDGIWTPGARWYMNNRKFWFRNEKDLALFLLKWTP